MKQLSCHLRQSGTSRNIKWFSPHPLPCAYLNLIGPPKTGFRVGGVEV